MDCKGNFIRREIISIHMLSPLFMFAMLYYTTTNAFNLRFKSTLFADPVK